MGNYFHIINIVLMNISLTAIGLGLLLCYKKFGQMLMDHHISQKEREVFFVGNVMPVEFYQIIFASYVCLVLFVIWSEFYYGVSYFNEQNDHAASILHGCIIAVFGFVALKKLTVIVESCISQAFPRGLKNNNIFKRTCMTTMRAGGICAIVSGLYELCECCCLYLKEGTLNYW